MTGSSLPLPQKVAHKTSFVFRYANKGIHEAVLQKLARSISGLNAVAVLLKAGYVQEAGVLFRTLDELHEDIFFLASAETNGARTDRHAQYLEAFYAGAVSSRPEGSMDIPKPNLVPRKKIRAHTMNTLGQEINVSQALAAGEIVNTAYSGYVHAASENIMEMYGGNPPRFHIEGMSGMPRAADCARDAEIYVYRGLMATTVAAKAFGEAVPNPSAKARSNWRRIGLPTNSMNLTNRVALITGAAGCIGSAVCRELAAQGAALCLVDTASTASLAAELRAAGHKVKEVSTDVTSHAAITQAVRKACETLGCLDILVNVAGTVALGAAADISEAEWDRVVTVNLEGTFLACQAAMAPVRAQRYGRIINIGSVLGKTAACGVIDISICF